MGLQSLWRSSALFLLLLALPVKSQFYFLVPPSPGRNNAYEYNSWYEPRQELNIIWKGTLTDFISIAIHQRRPTRDEAEFILKNVSGLSYFLWIISTKKNLAESNVFYLNIYPGVKLVSTASTR
ncbi:hypothetical protein ETB97_006293 [Aspergillus alliaceus]|uniref:Uncharacterized protein n=1 Tax=Petromyces alliaceus TaxID=209559 RepID=A0A8H5ZXU2_PETAA|nr:hypothetical protein ETB97_006293 [Aspergillus burnettii]